jgi:hypothetical protein
MKQMYEIFQSTDPDFSQVYKEISFIREQFILLQFTLTKQAIWARKGVEANEGTKIQGFFSFCLCSTFVTQSTPVFDEIW